MHQRAAKAGSKADLECVGGKLGAGVPRTPARTTHQARGERRALTSLRDGALVGRARAQLVALRLLRLHQVEHGLREGVGMAATRINMQPARQDRSSTGQALPHAPSSNPSPQVPTSR